MTRLRSRAAIYLQIATMWPQITYVYRVNLATQLVSVLLQVFLLKVVWTALYAEHGSVAGLSLHALVAYLTLTNLQLWLMFPFITSLLQGRVRDGTVALDLIRPVGLMGQMLAQQAGATAGVVPFVVLALPLALLLGGMEPPSSAGTALCYLVSLVLAYLITVLLGLLIGLVAFWTLELGGLIGIYMFTGQFFSGALVPLRFFPQGLHTVAAGLPFQAQAAIPVSIYLGQIRDAALVRALTLQLVWVVALSVAAGAVWQRALRRVVIQGG